jgi:hypothetical protein
VPIIAVAAVDILGVQGLVAKADQCLSAINAIGKLVKNASERRLFGPSQNPELMFDFDHYFGDSVYLFADPNLELHVQVQRLLIRVATLITAGLLWGETRFLVRAALAIGDLRKRVVSSEREAREVRIGTSMVRAHQLQEAQDWIGAAVDAAVPCNLETAKWTIQFPVPLKPSAVVSAPPIALNWIGANCSRARIEDALHGAACEAGLTENAKTKLRNTLQFVGLVYDVAKFAPFEWPEG